MELPLGWHTDLAVLRAGRSVVEEHQDHLVVRSPDNPTYHWGHFVLVTDPAAVTDADRWIRVFLDAFPGVTHRALGLIVPPVSDDAWTGAGLGVDRDEVLVAREPLHLGALDPAYRVRTLVSAADWERSNDLRETSYPGHPDFTRGTTTTRAAMAERGEITWFGAFTDDGELGAELGILDCGDGIARFQAVLTAPDHRRRGLISHLLAVADAHARAQGATTTVIIADEGAAAARLYRSVGFVDDSRKAQAYRFSVDS